MINFLLVSSILLKGGGTILRYELAVKARTCTNNLRVVLTFDPMRATLPM